MKCRQCAAEIVEESAFCNRCGAEQAVRGPLDPRPGAGAEPPPEETVWRGRYSARADLHLWLLWVVWVGVVIAAHVLFVTASTTWTTLTFLALGLFPAAWIAVRTLLRKLSVRYRLTNQRFFRQRGILSRHHDELELIRVDDIEVTQNLVQRLFGVGTVTIVSTDATHPRLPLEGIREPLETKEKIRTLVRARRSRTTFLETL